MKKIILVLWLLSIAYPASASTWYGTKLGPVGSGGQTVYYSFDGETSDSNAGLISIYNNWNGQAFDNYFGYGFCIQPAKDLSSGYADLVNFDQYNDLSEPALKKAAWLFDTYWTSGNTLDQNAGLQLSIWDAIYDDSTFTVNPTSDTPKPNNTVEIYNYYRLYIDSLNNNQYTGNNYQVLEFTGESGENQDLLVKVVPEPATMLLFGLGLLGISAVGRKRS